MRVLVIENYAGTSLGQVGTALDEAGAAVDLRRPYQGDPVPERADGFDALILLGGAQNALDDDNHAWFGRTLELIRDFGRQDKAVLGVCLGAQLIARAHGARNHIGGHNEFGWHEVAVTPEAAADPVFSALPPAFPIFEWHDDHFDLPAGAVRLASSPVAANQAFRIGRATYGTQFHFEADRALVAQWSEAFAALLGESRPDWAAGEHRRQAGLWGEAADAAGLAIARAWVARIGR